MRTFFVAVSLAVLVGCNKPGSVGSAGKSAGKSDPTGPPTITASLATPVKKTVKWTVEQPGIVSAFESTPLVAKFAGYVRAIHVDIDSVTQGPKDGKPGTLLVELHMPEVEQEYKQKRAQAESASAEVELARKSAAAASAAVATADAQVREAAFRERAAQATFARWKSESARIDDLLTRKVLGQQNADEALNQLRNAESMWEEAKARTGAVQAAHVEAQAKKAQADAAVAAAIARGVAADAEAKRVAALLDYSRIYAPYDGVVTGRFVHTGHFLQPNSAKAEPILTVMRTDKVRIRVDIPEQSAALMSAGRPAKLRIPGLRDAVIDAVIARTSFALSADVHTLTVELELPVMDRRVRPGMYVYAQIPVETVDAWMIPSSSVTHQDDLSYCFLMIDGKAVRHVVRLGRIDGELVEVSSKRRATPAGPTEVITGQEKILVGSVPPAVDGAIVELKK